MKFVDEYRSAEATRRIAGAIAETVTQRWTIMEVCGGQTHAIVRFGIDELLPDSLTLVHGPGCPVCVTPVTLIDAAVAIAARPGVILCSFGDMLRVPGTRDSLFEAKARGADVRVVYSPLDALAIAEHNPEREVVFFAVGFETTAPANAMAVHQARRKGMHNFSVLVSQVLVPPAIEAIMGSPSCRVDGFLAAGHVCAVMGCDEYEPLARRYRLPIVVTGFEPFDILHGIHMVVRQLEEGRYQVENQYARSVREHGNDAARNLISEVFEITHREWRGIGTIPHSGLRLRERYAGFDAGRRFGIADDESSPDAAAPGECIAGVILQGLARPNECPAFADRCTPERPLGATMVSSEGACAAYYRYRRLSKEQ